MPDADTSALALAGQLRALGDDALVELLAAREIRETGIRDFFDLADALLDPESIQRALAHLDRPTLATLAALGEHGPASDPDPAHLDAALKLALVTESNGMFAVPASVTQRLRQWPDEGLPSAAELTSVPPPPAIAPVSRVDARFTDTVASERAFTTTTSVAELVTSLQHESARELARGGIALPDSKRLSAAMGVELDAVPSLLDIASRADLAARQDGRWMPTAAATQWLLLSAPERWATLAESWMDALPADIRSLLALGSHASWGERLDDYTSWLYPAGGDWMRERIATYTRDAELLGITADSVPSTPGSELLAKGAQPAADSMAQLFPAEVHTVYVQHDLSIVSPGPLAAGLDSRLRSIADVEGRGLATTYRVSPASLYRAMAMGETASTVREFLSEISSTGIPQPLDYLLNEAAARYGLVRVGAIDGARAYVRSTDDTLLRTLLVDQDVAALGLTRAGDRLLSRFDYELVFWSLAEARYPVVAEDSSGNVVVLARRQATRAAASTAHSPAVTLIEKLRLGSSSDPEVTGQAWLSRQLDVAIRGKLGLTVTVTLPDGSSMDYQLEPTSVAGGRLRARDRKSDIERTLPLSSIVAVGPAL